MMKWLFAYLAAVALVLLAFPALAATDLKPEDLLAKHLQSIGASDARNSKSRVVEGVAQYRILVGGSGQAAGKSVFASEGPKTHILLKVSADRYHGEQLVSDGRKVGIAGTYTDKSRSEFGDFLLGEDEPLREGLLGGVLSTAWPLLDLNARGPSLEFNGLKNIDGRSLYAMRYKPKKGTDLAIMLYFDPETYRHVMTVYSVSRAADLGSFTYNSQAGTPFSTGASETMSARRHEARYRIEERFGDFKTTDGLTLPTHYDLRFTEELESGFTKTVEWDVTTSTVLNGVALDPRNFEIR
jgi:hypothetical protein